MARLVRFSEIGQGTRFIAQGRVFRKISTEKGADLSSVGDSETHSFKAFSLVEPIGGEEPKPASGEAADSEAALAAGDRDLGKAGRRAIRPGDAPDSELGGLAGASSSSAEGEGGASVDDLGLPPKISKALKDGGYSTVESVMSAEDDELTELPGIGDSALQSIRSAVEAYTG